jgi:hypothetical protein
MNRLSRGWALGVLFACVPACSAKETGIAPDLSRVNDAKVWSVINADCETTTEGLKRIVRMNPKGGDGPGSNVGMALIEGVEFGEGTLEVDLKGGGKTDRTFVGVAFHVADAKTFEAVYFRPFNFQTADKEFRARAVQYVSWPDNTWEALRAGKPGVYESAVNPAPDPAGWFHARVEVTKQKVKVWVDGVKEPCLVVDRLGDRKNGKVGLWVDSRGGSFSNLRIVPAE